MAAAGGQNSSDSSDGSSGRAKQTAASTASSTGSAAAVSLNTGAHGYTPAPGAILSHPADSAAIDEEDSQTDNTARD